MYSQPQPVTIVNHPPTTFYKPSTISTPPSGIPAQQLVKIEPVKRQPSSYTFRTINNQSGRDSHHVVEVTQISSKSQHSNAQYSNYGGMQKAKDLDATFNPNQIDNGIFSRTYESTVTLRGGEGVQQRKVSSFPETETQKFFTKYAKGSTTQDRPSSVYQAVKKEEDKYKYSYDPYLFQSLKGKGGVVGNASDDNLLYQSLQKKEEPPTSLPPVNKATFMETYYESLVEPVKFDNKRSGFGGSSYSYSETHDYKDKVAAMTQDLTKNSLEKGQLIIEVAQLTRKNRDLVQQNQKLRQEKKILSESGDVILQLKNEGQKTKEENRKLQEQKEHLYKKVEQLSSQVQQLTTEIEQLNNKVAELTGQVSSLQDVMKNQPKGILIDEQILVQIEGIKQRQMQLNKLKSQFFSILQSKYQDQMARLVDLNNTFKTDIKNLKFDLDLAKESIKDKQLKLDYLQKELEAQQAKNRSQSKSIREQVQAQVHQKSNEIIALKHSLHSLEVKYKAQRKELADKDDFIAKYLAGRGGEDAETIRMLIDKYNYISKQQFEEISQIPKELRIQTPLTK